MKLMCDIASDIRVRQSVWRRCASIKPWEMSRRLQSCGQQQRGGDPRVITASLKQWSALAAAFINRGEGDGGAKSLGICDRLLDARTVLRALCLVDILGSLNNFIRACSLQTAALLTFPACTALRSLSCARPASPQTLTLSFEEPSLTPAALRAVNGSQAHYCCWTRSVCCCQRRNKRRSRVAATVNRIDKHVESSYRGI
jgi:hypothetical protein